MDFWLPALILIASAAPIAASRGLGRWRWLPFGAAVALGLALLTVSKPKANQNSWLPHPALDAGFVTSDRCRSCHPDQYASWHRSFHRTMTQPATPQSVLADFDGVELETRGRQFRLSRRGDEFWVDSVDPAWEMLWTPRSGDPSIAPRVSRRIVMATGSHHFQTYWMARDERSGMYFQFPWVYFIREGRWIPHEDSFLQPPNSSGLEIQVWNDSCILCHSVGGEPHLDFEERTMMSRSAELGIACEACHGEAREHVAVNSSPLRRYLLHLSDQGDSSVVNPRRLDGKRATETCGSCHSASSEIDSERWQTRGREFRPGLDLRQTRRILRYEDPPSDPLLLAWLREEPDGLHDRFWPDGTMRVTGREYNALLESGCYQRGELSCLSCHSMHSSEPNDQLADGMDGDQACLQCHASFGGRQHTHHEDGSSGSACYNCHMPRTTYGLLTAIRSHRIDSPSVSVSAETGRPNACNLCHLDQPLDWTARHLESWYGIPSPQLSEENQSLSAAVIWLLRGDAVQRAMAAWHMGWDKAVAASGEGWQPRFLAPLLDDPYSAVRFIAFDALRKHSGFEDLDYDFLAPPAERTRLRTQALERAREHETTRETLPDPATAQSLLDQRNDRPVKVVE